AVLVFDQRLEPWFPFLFLLVQVLAGLACFELLRLLPSERRPPAWLCQGAVATLIAANWVVLVPFARSLDRDAWLWVLGVLAAVVLVAYLVELAVFREPGESVMRIALTVCIAGYLGLLPSFLAQLRWLPAAANRSGPVPGIVALALAVFVPKCCDTGAYF